MRSEKMAKGFREAVFLETEWSTKLVNSIQLPIPARSFLCLFLEKTSLFAFPLGGTRETAFLRRRKKEQQQ